MPRRTVIQVAVVLALVALWVSLGAHHTGRFSAVLLAMVLWRRFLANG